MIAPGDPPINLPPYHHDNLCPKCRFMAGTTKYHATYGLNCAVPGSSSIAMYWSMPRWNTERTPKEIESDQRMTEVALAIPEHFDRECPNCQHLWAEGLPYTENHTDDEPQRTHEA